MAAAAAVVEVGAWERVGVATAVIVATAAGGAVEKMLTMGEVKTAWEMMVVAAKAVAAMRERELVVGTAVRMPE